MQGLISDGVAREGFSEEVILELKLQWWEASHVKIRRAFWAEATCAKTLGQE